MLLLVYVDDILITGEHSDDIQQVIKDLHNQFALKTLGSVSYFLGFEVIEVAKNGSGLHLSQTRYAIDLLHKTNMTTAKPISSPMSINHRLSLHESSVLNIHLCIGVQWELFNISP